jgi:hypothetical protein
MYKIGENMQYKSLDNKQDLISLIRAYNQNKWTIKELNKLSKKQLFMVYGKVNFEYVKNKGV